MKGIHRRCRPTLERLEARCLLSADDPVGAVISLHPACCCCGGCGHDGHAHGPADVRTDSAGLQFYHDPVPALTPEEILPEQATTVSGSGTVAAASGSLSVPILHSNPGAARKIFLDFDGHVVRNTSWNKYNRGRDIHAPAYDIDGNIFSFSSAEINNITEIWRRVAEDYAPFNVDVTTQDPGSAAFTSGGQAIRVLISTNRDESALGGTGAEWYGSAGGIAYLNSWNWTSDTPVWVFENKLGNGNVKYVAEVASHETGHAFGLGHDGSSSTSYYAGQGSGDTSWAPIMGLSYYKQVTQWSKGEYSGANNTQDDLSLIAAALGYRGDDHGNTPGSATRLNVATSGRVYHEGLISTRTDVDVFAFASGGGAGSLTVTPVGMEENWANLDVRAWLVNAAGQTVAVSAPTNSLAATLTFNAPAGTYYLHVQGTGLGDPRTTGYSDYASLGNYTVAGTVPAGTLAADTIDLRQYRILSYAGNQDFSGTAVVANSGSTLALTGNVWKAIVYNYTITPNTVLEFDFSSSAEGEIHGIGLDTNLTYTSARTFQVHGSQRWGVTTYNNYQAGAPTAKHYVIPVGQFYTGDVKYLFFANDHDVSNPTGQGQFSNIRIYEKPSTSTTLLQSGLVAGSTGGWVAAAAAVDMQPAFDSGPAQHNTVAALNDLDGSSDSGPATGSTQHMHSQASTNRRNRGVTPVLSIAAPTLDLAATGSSSTEYRGFLRDLDATEMTADLAGGSILTTSVFS